MYELNDGNSQNLRRDHIDTSLGVNCARIDSDVHISKCLCTTSVKRSKLDANGDEAHEIQSSSEDEDLPELVGRNIGVKPNPWDEDVLSPFVSCEPSSLSSRYAKAIGKVVRNASIEYFNAEEVMGYLERATAREEIKGVWNFNLKGE